MADEFHGHACISVELFFKGKDAEGVSEPPAHQIHAPGPPCPELRANVINVSNAPGAQLARETQVEAGVVRQDGEGRATALGFVSEATHGAEHRRQTLEDFGDSDHGNFCIVRDDLDACGAHLRPAHAKNRHVQALLQRCREPRSVHVSGASPAERRSGMGGMCGWRKNQSLAGNTEGSAERLASMGRCSSCSLYCNWYSR